MDLLAALTVFYSGFRAITFQGATSDVFAVGGTIIAGCSLAVTSSRVLLVRLLHQLSVDYVGLHITNVVDDVSLASTGPSRYVSSFLARAGSDLLKGLAERKLVVNVAKTVFIANNDEVSAILLKAWPGVQRKESHRNLGTDAFAFPKAATPVGRKRCKLGMAVGSRLKRLRATVGGSLLHMHRAAVQAKVLWGSQVRGLPPHTVRALQASAAARSEPGPTPSWRRAAGSSTIPRRST